jgi:hypothetical protein
MVFLEEKNEFHPCMKFNINRIRMQKAPVQLPSLLMIRLQIDNEYSPYVLVNTYYKGNTIGMELCKHPMRTLQEGYLKEDGLELPAWKYTIEKESGTIETKLWRTNRYIQLHQQNIYEYMMLHPNSVLPKQVFAIINKGEDSDKIWHFNIQDIQTRNIISDFMQRLPAEDSKRAIQPTKIPNHIFRVYVENAVLKGEECPITLEKFTTKTVGCTPCGHLFEKNAIKKAIDATRKCPTCRAETRREDIQTWE